MQNIFQSKSVLVVNDNEHSRKMLVAVMRVIGFRNIEQTARSGEAFTKFQNDNHDVIIGDIKDGVADVLALCDQIRKSDLSPNQHVPVLAVAGQNAMHLIGRAKDVLITDLLQSPYSVDNISGKLKYILGLEQQQLENIQETYETVAIESQSQPVADDDVIEGEVVEVWPDEEEANGLTSTLLDHYLKHHEIVFSKLKVAQSATQQCMDGVRDVYDKVRDKDNTNIMQFKDFDKMWEDVLAMFMQGGLAEQDLHEIEKLITVIPEDIRQYYDDISQQDKSFLSLIDSLNAAAYKKAKEKVVKLQAQPNPLNGKTSDDYERKEDDVEQGSGVKAFMYRPKPRG